MSSNWHAINSSTRMMVEQRRQEAEEHRLATLVMAGRPGRWAPLSGFLRKVIARIRVGSTVGAAPAPRIR